MRAALLAATILTAGFGVGAAHAASPVQASAEAAQREPIAALRATAPPNAAPDRTYDTPSAALLEADLDYLARNAPGAIARGDREIIWPVLLFANDLAAGRYTEARATLAATPGGAQGALGNLLEPFLLAAEGQVDRGVDRVGEGGGLPAPLADVQRALIFESAGRLQEASAIYSIMAEHIDLTPPPDDEPASMEEFQRVLNAPRITHAMYRAALVQHRLGDADGARRLYGIVAQFAPRSADVERNLARLESGQPPLEPALTPVSATGRWLLFLSQFLTQSEALNAVLTQGRQADGLASTSGALFLQLGLALAPDADDWRLAAASELIGADGFSGAQRILNMVNAEGPFAPEAEISRALILIEQHKDDDAAAAAARAVSLGGQRWGVVASAGDIYRSAGRQADAIRAYTRALEMANDPKDRADILGYRAFAHRFAGDQAAATADMRAALALDRSVNRRMLYVSVLMEDPRAWQDGIDVARGLFSEQPDSVSRLNTLGYALIQRPEGLEEGYRLLWRGFTYGQSDAAVVDSLGWAYYLHGHFDDARTLIARANELSGDDPNPEILDHLGDVNWRMGDREAARAAWRSALEARPELPRMRSLQQKIARGLTTPAPRLRELPDVNLPDAPGRRDEL